MVLTWVLILAPASFAEVPDLLLAKAANEALGVEGAGELLWISDRALDTEHGTRWDLLDPEQQLELQRRVRDIRTYTPRLERAPGSRPGEEDCLVWTGEPAYHGPPASSLADLVASSEAIVHGTVIDSRAGLYGGRVGTLLEVEGRALGSPISETGSTTELLFFPHGKVRVDGVWVCHTTARRGGAPSRGAEIMAFLFEQMPGPAGIRHIGGRHLIWNDSAGGLSIDRSIQLDPAIRSVDELARILDSLFGSVVEE